MHIMMVTQFKILFFKLCWTERLGAAAKSLVAVRSIDFTRECNGVCTIFLPGFSWTETTWMQTSPQISVEPLQCTANRDDLHLPGPRRYVLLIIAQATFFFSVSSVKAGLFWFNSCSRPQRERSRRSASSSPAQPINHKRKRGGFDKTIECSPGARPKKSVSSRKSMPETVLHVASAPDQHALPADVCHSGISGLAFAELDSLVSKLCRASAAYQSTHDKLSGTVNPSAELALRMRQIRSGFRNKIEWKAVRKDEASLCFRVRFPPEPPYGTVLSADDDDVLATHTTFESSVEGDARVQDLSWTCPETLSPNRTFHYEYCQVMLLSSVSVSIHLFCVDNKRPCPIALLRLYTFRNSKHNLLNQFFFSERCRPGSRKSEIVRRWI